MFACVFWLFTPLSSYAILGHTLPYITLTGVELPNKFNIEQRGSSTLILCNDINPGLRLELIFLYSIKSKPYTKYHITKARPKQDNGLEQGPRGKTY